MSKHLHFSVGVGGLVVNDAGQVLLVRLNYSQSKDKWMFPGGYVDEREMLQQAVIREVKEEAGIEADPLGVVGVRHRLDETRNVYVVFLMRYVSGSPTADGIEVSDARFWDVCQIQESDEIVGLVQAITAGLNRGALSEPFRELHVPDRSGEDWALFGW